MLAVKAARDCFRLRRPEIREPEMVLSTTAHAAFLKAAHYLRVKPVQVPVDPETYRADVSGYERAITPNTILLVGSAPSYAHGVVDPIGRIGEVALKYGLLFHVDACAGGFLLPYFRRLGVGVPDFDFEVPGVTSISMDLHKYAYTPKGASVVLYRGRELRKFQAFVSSRWTGYPLVNNTVQSSKSGGPVAAAWAVLNHVGDGGYLELARKKLEAMRSIVRGIRSMGDLRIMGEPEMCLLAVASDTVNIFHVVDEMHLRGWYAQPVLAFDNSKENMHITINASNAVWVDAFLEDLAESVEKAKRMKDPDPAHASLEGTTLPERMASINTALNLLSPELRERMIIDYVDILFGGKEAD
jgi:glutamate/tyrosine decarboxylase-like PLP-dependent enzyme